MKKTFQKNLVAAAVAIIASAGVQAADVGQANLLFPYITTASTAFTFVTITNRSANTASADVKASNMTVGVPMHFAYGVKDVAAVNSAACIHADGMAFGTANDVMQFEVADKVNMALIGGEGTGTQATSSYYPYQIQNRHGFLIVNADVSYGAPAAARLYGEATIIDTASGLSTTYSARGMNTTTSANPDFTLPNLGVTGGAEVAPDGVSDTGLFTSTINSHGRNVVTWMADSVVSTSWFVVPLGRRSEMTPSSNGGIVAGYAMTSDRQLQTGAYDMNEGFHSGGARTDARCVGILTRNMMLDELPVLNTKLGGTANMVFFNQTSSSSTPVDSAPAGGVAALAGNTGATWSAHKSLAYKIMSSTALGTSKTTVSREAHY